jgi:selenocysteine-specific elongation factor
VRSLIVGTAGHIDHGKSALVRALTGTDPDRLKEEKERGITIDLGFAHVDLGDGLVASFIDVPGHERFVRNMLAGAHGIDAVLLVVAADESVMPQTREHFHICRLLGVERGLIALTKCDVADADSQALAEMETRELVAGSFLDGAPVLRVSARTGQGLEGLREALRTLAHSTRPRGADGLLRLPIDRAFTLHGFGTVVTGTLVSGALAIGEEVEALPSRRRARVRGLQVHGSPVQQVGAGHRTAVNLAGIEVAELARGDVLARPGTFTPTSILDVELSLLPGTRPLTDQTRVRVHIASAEVLARVRLLQPRPIEAGGSGPAQLRLERRAVAGRGDRLIVRSYSPATTIGGAVVLDPLAPRRRGKAAAVTARAADPAEAAVAMIEEAGIAGLEGAALSARVTAPLASIEPRLAADARVVVLGSQPSWFISAAAVRRIADDMRAELERFHAAHPLRAAMPREELRSRLFTHAPPPLFDHLLARLATEGRVRLLADGIAAAGHEVRLSADEDAARRRLVEAASAAGLEGVDLARVSFGSDPRLLERVARVLVDEGALRRVGETYVHASALDALKDEVRRRWPPGSRLEVGGFKDLTGLSRKFVIPLLEYLDREKVTRRSGADRVVL